MRTNLVLIVPDFTGGDAGGSTNIGRGCQVAGLA